jgi:hypothetical protein
MIVFCRSVDPDSMTIGDPDSESGALNAGKKYHYLSINFLKFFITARYWYKIVQTTISTGTVLTFNLCFQINKKICLLMMFVTLEVTLGIRIRIQWLWGSGFNDFG